MKPATLFVVLALIALSADDHVVAAQGLPTYRFPGFRGRVVADETSRPLSGVSVLAWWGPGGIVKSLPKVARVVETETQADGTFELAAWEATTAIPISSSAPGFMFFAPGFDADQFARSSTQFTDKPGEFRLHPFNGLLDNRASQLRQFAWTLGLMWALLY